MRARDLFPACGRMPPGARNTIADVPGVRVGHHTLIEGELRTGVTAIVPHGGNVFRDKPLAAADVLNGFGKSIGLMQVEELGQLETPILLTNTLSVGTCANALIRRAIGENPDIGRGSSTVNPVVCECNDGFLSDIQAMAVTEAHALAALDTAAEDFAVGAIGAGTGMSCFGFKGGIGSASRRVTLDGVAHHVGILLLANFGRAGDLLLPDGRRIDPGMQAFPERGSVIVPPEAGSVIVPPEAGSVIVVVATDIPLDHRQLKRVIRRAGAGIAWAGSFWGNGSGDLAIGFSTANRIDHDAGKDISSVRMLNENRIDLAFQAVAEATREAVLDALAASDSMTGRAGHRRIGLRHALLQDELGKNP